MSEIIIDYSRAEAIEDGEQIEVSKQLLQEAGFKFPLFITRGVNEIIQNALTNNVNDYNGIMWDIINMLRFAIKASKRPTRTVKFKTAIFWTDNRSKDFEFIGEIGALDFDNHAPALTVMLPSDI